MNLADAAAAIREGEISAVRLADDVLSRIGEVDGNIMAWAHINPDRVLEEARARDDQRRQGRTIGPLHGVPIALKDIIDTAHMPTEYGCAAFKGRVPYEDAWIVSRLRQHGAVVLGKTVTAELANLGPGQTRNPHNPKHTPGGSSSGSAAAVASFMAPGAIGTQTGGSVIRPASYCGVYGFKPTYGMIPRTGVLLQSDTLDHIGTFARSIRDLALLSESLFGYDPGDRATCVVNYPQPLAEIAVQAPPVGIRLGFARTHKWDQADANCQAAFGELVEVLGDNVEDLEMTAAFINGWDGHRTIMDADNAFHYGAIYDKCADRLHPVLCRAIERGREITAEHYLKAHQMRHRLQGLWNQLLEDHDAVITPAATGEAPSGLETTGDPVFCSLWSFLGVPTVCLPLMTGENGLPLGVQLVGRSGEDARLLRTANWLVGTLSKA